MQWAEGTGPLPALSGYLVSHSIYIALTAALYLLFGAGNRFALITFQIIISAALFPLILHISMKSYRSGWIAVLFTSVSFLFYDNIRADLWASPESVYRFGFFISYFLLVAFYFARRDVLFFSVGGFAFFVLALTRIDTVILFSPVYVLGMNIIRRGTRAVKIGAIVFTVLAGLVAGAFYEKIGKMEVLQESIGVVRHFYMAGVIIVEQTRMEPFDQKQAGNSGYIIRRTGKLAGLRMYQFLNVLPPFFPPGHKVYYAVHMLPLYGLCIFGVIRSWKTRDRYFVVYLGVYIASMILHVVTRVDPALRTTFTALPYMIMYAGYGFDYLYNVYGKSERWNTAAGVEVGLRCGVGADIGCKPCSGGVVGEEGSATAEPEAKRVTEV